MDQIFLMLGGSWSKFPHKGIVDIISRDQPNRDVGIDETWSLKIIKIKFFFSKKNEDILTIIDQIKRLKCTLQVQRPNLKNSSGGLNLGRGLNMVGSTYNCIKCFKI